jgi:adenylylsulfate kinase
MVIATFKRRFLKTAVWRIIGALLTFVAVAVFANFFAALTLAGVAGFSDLIFKTVGYYLHEKAWDRTRYGLELENRKGCCLWLTGLPCSGKTTIALELVKRLENNLYRTEYLDGDIVRKNICSDLGFTKEDRNKNIKRITLVSSFLSSRAITVCSFVSPYREARANAREKINNFIEIYVDCPVDECIKRDVKGMYAKALAGEIKGFTGVDDPYETPENPEVVCFTDKETVSESTDKIIEYLKKNKYIK